MAVITVSRQFGAGGLTLGRRLADRLGYRLVHEEIIKQVAERGNISQEGAQALEITAGSKLMRLLDKLVSVSYLDRLLEGNHGYLTEDRYLRLTRQVINEVAEAGNAVIIGRGGQYILKDRPGVWHVFLTADEEYRTRFISERYALPWDTAEQVVRRHDRERQQYLNCFGAGPHDDPIHYHLSCCTSLVSLEKAESLVLELMK